MTFKDFVGQDSVKERLSRDVLGVPSHAYLLTGALGMGKTSFGMALANALLCKNPSSDGACGKCNCCMCFMAGTNPDFRRLTIPEDKKQIRVEDVRKQVVGDVSISSQLSDRKVYMIDGDGLNEEGQNALLKSIEEPPKHVCFIIESSDSTKLLPTVVSRMSEIKLSPLSENETLEVLTRHVQSMDNDEDIDTSIDSLRMLAAFSGGNPGRAIATLSETDFGKEIEEITNIVLKMPETSFSDIVCDTYNYFNDNKDRIEELLLLMLWVFGDLCYLCKSENQEDTPIRNGKKRQEYISFLKKNKYITLARLGKAADLTTEFMKRLAVNVSFESACCNLLIKIKKELTND